MIGSLLYLTTSRPDIMFSVCLCARFQEAPKTSHLEAVKRIFRYIKGTAHLGLWYPKGTGIAEVVRFSESLASGNDDFRDTKSVSWIPQFEGFRESTIFHHVFRDSTFFKDPRVQGLHGSGSPSVLVTPKSDSFDFSLTWVQWGLVTRSISGTPTLKGVVRLSDWFRVQWQAFNVLGFREIGSKDSATGISGFSFSG
ncbi:hypothetical protein Tco_0700570 [Tanacetum coccineum]